NVSDPEPRLGRRLGWYALVRVLKPRVVVETGVDKGLGGVALCAALLRNESEGYPGLYYGIDINDRAGWLISGRYKSVGKVLYGDSIESLKKLDVPIDFFISDSDHSAEYEYAEYQTVKHKLSIEAVIIGDNCHETTVLSQFSKETGRSFIFFAER